MGGGKPPTRHFPMWCVPFPPSLEASRFTFMGMGRKKWRGSWQVVGWGSSNWKLKNSQEVTRKPPLKGIPSWELTYGWWQPEIRRENQLRLVVEILLFTGVWDTSQVVQDFLDQRYPATNGSMIFLFPFGAICVGFPTKTMPSFSVQKTFNK